MDRKINIEKVRSFIAAANKQFEQGGIFIGRIRFKRSETGTVESIYIDYEEREVEAGQKVNANEVNKNRTTPQNHVKT